MHKAFPLSSCGLTDIHTSACVSRRTSYFKSELRHCCRRYYIKRMFLFASTSNFFFTKLTRIKKRRMRHIKWTHSVSLCVAEFSKCIVGRAAALQKGSVAGVNMGQHVPRIEKHTYTSAFVRLGIPANTVKKAVSSQVDNWTYRGSVITSVYSRHL